MNLCNGFEGLFKCLHGLVSYYQREFYSNLTVLFNLKKRDRFCSTEVPFLLVAQVSIYKIYN